MTISDKDIDRTGSDFGQHLVNMALQDVYKRQLWLCQGLCLRHRLILRLLCSFLRTSVFLRLLGPIWDSSITIMPMGEHEKRHSPTPTAMPDVLGITNSFCYAIVVVSFSKGREYCSILALLWVCRRV